MPIYEYECSECKTVFEKLLTSASTETEVVCTKCNSTKVQKIMSAGSLRVGSGEGLPIAPPSGGGCGGGSGFSWATWYDSGWIVPYNHSVYRLCDNRYTLFFFFLLRFGEIIHPFIFPQQSEILSRYLFKIFRIILESLQLRRQFFILWS